VKLLRKHKEINFFASDLAERNSNSPRRLDLRGE
jgi:hypothetical protein